MKKLKVNIKLNKNATIDSLLNENFDEIIIATGAKPITVDLPGIYGENVVLAVDVINGIEVTGDKVLIVGGGMIGCETAEFLASQGKKVSIIEMLPKIARDIGPTTRWSVTMRINRWGIILHTSSKVIRITKSGVEIEREGDLELIEADTVVIAAGMESNNELVNQLKGKLSNIHVIGDSSQARRMLDAIHEGYALGQKI